MLPVCSRDIRSLDGDIAMRLHRWLVPLCSAWLLAATSALSFGGDTMRVYVGTYTQRDSKGIYLLELDLKTGQLTDKGLVAEVRNPSFVALDPTQTHLYAVSEVSDIGEKKVGGVTAFAIDADSGQLKELNRQPSGGAGPGHLVVAGSGKCVLVANYGGGSVACLPIERDGKLKPVSSFHQHKGSSVDKGRQEAPHGHSINVDAANEFAIAADLGLDKLLVYRLHPPPPPPTPTQPPP